MNLAEIEKNVAELDLSAGFDFIYDLLLAYDLPKSGVTLLTSAGQENDGLTRSSVPPCFRGLMWLMTRRLGSGLS